MAIQHYISLGFLGPNSKEPACQCRLKRCGLNPWVGKIPWRRAWQPTLVFLPGEFHGQKSVMGYNPKSQTQLKRLSTHTDYINLSVQHDWTCIRQEMITTVSLVKHPSSYIDAELKT